MTKKQIKRILRVVFILASLTSLFFVPWILVKSWILPFPNNIQEQMDEAIDHGFDGMIVYVDQASKTPMSFAAGWHDRKNKMPADPNALFKIASISKLYVAAAISKLVYDNHLSLDETLVDYFPELIERVDNAEGITIRLMVQHRSGIPNLTDSPGFWEDPPKNNKEALDLVLDLPGNFEPNKKYEYSNTNYLLLGEIIEKAIGYSHHQYIKEEILIPLALKNTFASQREVDLVNMMSGYYIGIESDIKTTDFGLDGYGSMVATAQDVGTFIRALNDGTLFNDAEQKIYTSIYKYGHTGLLPGYQSIAKYHKDIDAVVIQFLNTTDFTGYQWNLSQIVYNRIIKILRKQDSK